MLLHTSKSIIFWRELLLLFYKRKWQHLDGFPSVILSLLHFLAAYVLNISIELNMQTSYLHDVDLDRLPSYTLQMTFWKLENVFSGFHPNISFRWFLSNDFLKHFLISANHSKYSILNKVKNCETLLFTI